MTNLIHEFRRLVSQEGYFAFYLSYGDGNKSTEKWLADAKDLPQNLKSLVEIFLLNQAIPLQRLQEILGQDIINMLLSADILCLKEDKIYTDNLVLISFHSILFFCDNVRDPKVYFGNDSIALAVFQSPLRKGRALDLCAGSAIQSLIAAQSCDFAQAVEINEKAAKTAQFNILLNDASDKVKVTNQALENFAELDTGKYDLITFNPPLLPVPKPLYYPFVGDGGEDGLDVTRIILEKYIPMLSDTGSVEFIGCGLGKDDYPIFVDSLRPFFDKHNMQVNVHLLSYGKLDESDAAYNSSVFTTAVANQISTELCHNIYQMHYKKMDANLMYCFYIRAFKNPSQKPHYNIIRVSNPVLNWFLY